MSNVTNRPNGKPPRAGFKLDTHNAKLSGVCGGIANYANIDPTLVRLGFVVGAFVSLGTAALIYLAIALIAD